MKLKTMKKITMVACLFCAGMAIGATPTAQVYDIVLKVKTTAAAKATLDNKKNPLAVEVGDEARDVIYRKQSSATWKGLIWGCGCETINGKWEKVHAECEEEPVELETVKGCIIWDAKTKVPVYAGCFSDLADASSIPGTGFGWNFIHAINKDGKQVEGSWVMEQQGNACDESGTLFSFAGSGFGSANLIIENGTPTCISYIKSISGNFSGWMKAPTYTNQEGWSGCRCCGVPIPSSCDFAEAWDWCNWSYVCHCDSETSEWMDYTAAYGTWQIKYNAGLSKKLANVVKPASEPVSIRDAYDFRSLPYVETLIEEVEDRVHGIRSTCDELEDVVVEAQKNVKKAQDRVEEVSTANLLKNLENAEEDYNTASTNLTAKQTNYDELNTRLFVATSDRDIYSNSLYTAAWFINYVNLSQQTASLTGYGIDTFESAIEELKFFTFDSIRFGGEDIIPASYNNAVTFINNKNTLLENMDSEVENLTESLETADSELQTAKSAEKIYGLALDEAKTTYMNRTTLQIQAASDLNSAETRLSLAEAAYKAAGCN